MRNSLQINDEKAQLKKRAIELCEKCKTEIRDFTEEEQVEYNSIKGKIEVLNEELRKLDVCLPEDNTINKPIKRNIMKTEFRLIKAINDIANISVLMQLHQQQLRKVVRK